VELAVVDADFTLFAALLVMFITRKTLGKDGFLPGVQLENAVIVDGPCADRCLKNYSSGRL